MIPFFAVLFITLLFLVGFTLAGDDGNGYDEVLVDNPVNLENLQEMMLPVGISGYARDEPPEVAKLTEGASCSYPQDNDIEPGPSSRSNGIGYLTFHELSSSWIETELTNSPKVGESMLIGEEPGVDNSTMDLNATPITIQTVMAEKNQPWTKEEHMLFLMGMQEYGRSWMTISEKVVKTRTASQVKSHAQKFFRRQNVREQHPNKKLRPSIHDKSSIDAAFLTDNPSQYI